MLIGMGSVADIRDTRAGRKNSNHTFSLTGRCIPGKPLGYVWVLLGFGSLERTKTIPIIGDNIETGQAAYCY
jgi:hypothetical protein